jgi:hypothetical protein
MRGPVRPPFAAAQRVCSEEPQQTKSWVPAFAGTTRSCCSSSLWLSALLCFRSCFPGPSRPRRGREGESPKGRAHDARAFAVRPWMACQRTSVASSRSRRLHRRPRPCGSPLFGYFLWRDRESNSSAWTADETAHGRESGFVATSQEQSNSNNKTKQERSRAPSPCPLPQAEEGKSGVLSHAR